MRRSIYALACLLLLVAASLTWAASDLFIGGINCGQASKSISLVLRKTSDNTELTGVLASQVTANYWRRGASSTAISTATLANAAAAHSSGGFVEVNSTTMPGVYRFDLPDAAIACGADWVTVNVLKGYGTAFYAYNERFGLASAPDVNVVRWNGNNIAATNVDTNVVNWNGTAVIATQLNVNATKWNGTAVIATNVDVNIVKAAGTSWNSGAIASATFANMALITAMSVETGSASAVNAGTITLRSGASADTSDFVNQIICIIAAGTTGAGQCNYITAYDSSTKVVTLAQNWNNTPVGTITYGILPFGISISAAPTNFSSMVIDTNGRLDLSKWNGTSIIATNVDANTVKWNGTAVIATNVDANATKWNGTAVIATNVDVNVVKAAGTVWASATPTNFASMLISSAGINTAGGTLRKNVASQKYPVYLVDSSGAAATGKTVTVKVSKDGAAGAAIGGSVAEIDSTNVPGWYLVSFNQADTNCNVCVYVATATSTTPRAFYFVTAP